MAERPEPGQKASPATAGVVLPADLDAFCLQGVSVIFGVTGADGRPISGTGLACRILPEGRLRVLIRRRGNERALLALTGDGRLAVTISHPASHRSVQFKGSGAMIGAPREDDLRAARRQTRAFHDVILDLGASPRLADAYCAVDPQDLVALEMTPSAAFGQTPGPGAGNPLAP